MSAMGWWLVAVAALLVLLVVVLWRVAARIDRLHRRVVSSRSRLAKQLVKRNAETIQIATNESLARNDARRLHSTATKALLEAEAPLAADLLGMTKKQTQHESHQLDPALRLSAESAVSRCLREVLTPQVREQLSSDPLSAAQLEELDAACNRVRLLRSLHNQDIVQVRLLRRSPLAKIFRLAGNAPFPGFVDLDDKT